MYLPECLQQMIELNFNCSVLLDKFYIYQIIKTHQSKYVKLKESDREKQNLSKLTGPGSNRIRIFFKFSIQGTNGWIRILGPTDQ